jgi:hypothetical protein
VHKWNLCDSYITRHVFFKLAGPTKWLHLTPAAHDNIDQIHFKIWQDVWKNPHSSVDIADQVSKKVLG